MNKAPIGKRIIAYIIDCAIIGIIVTVLIGGMFVLSFAVSMVSDVLAALSFVLWMLVAFVATLFMVVYFLLRDGLNGGRSYGKKFMGLKVIKEGKPCSMKDSVLRNVVAMVLGPIDLVFVFIDADGRRLGDKVANTQVVEA